MSGYVAVIAVLCAAAVVLWSRWRIARTIKRLDQMLTAAMNDSFTETDFDESRLSALENRLARYLAASSLSARQVQGQKDQISTWISDISHQTKTPVANVLLYTQLLAEQPLTPQGKDCVHAIAAQAEKLQALIQALVKTSRLENGILVLHPQMGEIAPVVQRAVAQYAPRAAEKGLTLTAEAVEGTAVFDPKWTEEALCNLLDNAVKYTPPGGAVRVEVRSYELFAAVCCCLRDRYRAGYPGERAGADFRAVPSCAGGISAGGCRYWLVSHSADCRQSGWLCPSEQRAGNGQHVFALSAA